MERFTCRATVQGGRTPVTIYDSTVQAIFSNPLLEFTPPLCHFEYTWSPETAHATTMRREVTVRNVSQLALDMTLKCPSPFVLEAQSASLSLQPGEVTVLHVRSS